MYEQKTKTIVLLKALFTETKVINIRKTKTGINAAKNETFNI